MKSVKLLGMDTLSAAQAQLSILNRAEYDFGETLMRARQAGKSDHAIALAVNLSEYRVRKTIGDHYEALVATVTRAP